MTAKLGLEPVAMAFIYFVFDLLFRRPAKRRVIDALPETA